jgi:DNA-binding CsgD family transcriptional regulator
MPVPRAGKKALQVLVSPLRSERGSLPGGAVVVVFLNDPERQPALPAEVLWTLFGLTGAEARLTGKLMEGYSLSEISELSGLSRETVKSQMSAVFAKTGTRRQGELIRLLSRLPGCAT